MPYRRAFVNSGGRMNSRKRDKSRADLHLFGSFGPNESRDVPGKRSPLSREDSPYALPDNSLVLFDVVGIKTA